MAMRKAGKFETFLSITILMLLAVIAVIVLVMGQTARPRQYFLPTEPSSQAAIWKILPLQLKTTDGRIFTLTQKQYFPADRLFEKINGINIALLMHINNSDIIEKFEIWINL